MHPSLRALAEPRLGLFTTAEALAAGYGRGEIRSLVSTGRWVRLRRGVLVHADALAASGDDSGRHRIDCLAVLMSLQRASAVVSHASAARLWRVPVPNSADAVIRLTDPEQWRRGSGYLMTCAPVTGAERWRSGPVRLTSAPRTLVDCAREWPLDEAVVAMDAAVLAGRTTIEELRVAAAAVRGWPGSARAVRTVELVDGRAESPLETRGRLRIVGAGLPVPELQVEIWTEGHLVAVVDAWFDDAAVALEFDGRIKYDDPWRNRSPERVLWEEKRREDRLRALDVTVVRMTDADLRPAAWPHIENDLRRLLGRRASPADRRFTARPRPRGVQRAG